MEPCQLGQYPDHSFWFFAKNGKSREVPLTPLSRRALTETDQKLGITQT
jgi:hypothetical protein